MQHQFQYISVFFLVFVLVEGAFRNNSGQRKSTHDESPITNLNYLVETIHDGSRIPYDQPSNYITNDTISSMLNMTAVEEHHSGLPQGAYASRKLKQFSALFTVLNRDNDGDGFADDRKKLSNTKSFPYRTIGLITYEKQDGTSWICSGALISSRVVLTAAHCLFDNKTSTWYTDWKFNPGYNGDQAPYGTWDSVTARAPRGYTRSKLAVWDFGLILLAKSPGVGHMAYGYECPGSGKYITNLNIAGYPGDLRDAFGTTDMWRTYCEGIEVNMCDYNKPTFVQHFCDTEGGMSGGPMWEYTSSDDSRKIIGVHSLGSSNGIYNTAIAITPAVFEFIKNALDEWGESD